MIKAHGEESTSFGQRGKRENRLEAMIIVSDCLAGINCRWDGNSRPNKKIIDLIKQGRAIPVCPEQLGGLPTPRDPVEQRGNEVSQEMVKM